MRTKTLLITAALGAAGLMTASAQVYSVNAVGYVNLSLPTSADATLGTIIANPLNGTNNNLNTILPLTDDYDGSAVYRFDVATQNYAPVVTFYAGAGWLPADVVIGPGEGFWIFPVGPNPLNVTFVGEVPQGSLSNPLPPANLSSMRSSIVPQTAPLGDLVTPGTLGFAAEDGDAVYIFDSLATPPNFKPVYTYYDGAGWLSDNPGGTADGPVIPVATGFFLVKSSAATKTSWDRNFSVNP